MKSNYLITQGEGGEGLPTLPEDSLDINEFFMDSIQGEGVSAGSPAAFLRLKGCTLDCVWCDTMWRLGGAYSFTEIFTRMSNFGLIDKFANGQRLVFTGGSPLKQQERIMYFLDTFRSTFGFLPVTEIENECTIMPNPKLLSYIDIWNNSPKLSSSGMKRRARIHPEVLKLLSTIGPSWFKFVVSCEEDWEEIQMDFLDTKLIRKNQIILMPLASSVEELNDHRSVVISMAIKYGVRYSSREQLVAALP